MKRNFILILSSSLALGGFVFLFIHYAASSSRSASLADNGGAVQETKSIEEETIAVASTEDKIIVALPVATPSESIGQKDEASEAENSNSETSADGEKLEAAPRYPAQILNLANWKQTLPIGSSGQPTEIKNSSLKNYAHDSCFRVNSAGSGVVFRAPVNGVTTKGSSYPRSELREMQSGGDSMANWSTKSGTHTMFIDQAITAVPKNKKHVVAGQIHDADDDVIVIRLEYPKLFVDINGQEGPTLDSNYTLGKRFTVKFVAEGGQIKIFYNGASAPAYTLKKSTSGCYFKAGAYTQSNCSKEKDCSSGNYGEVVIYDLDVRHS
jgi:hypothetical protein